MSGLQEGIFNSNSNFFLETSKPKSVKILIGIIWKGKFRGQKQKWFIIRFLGEDNDININTKHPEFIDWRWIDPKNLPDVIVNFKKDLYINLLKEIKATVNL